MRRALLVAVTVAVSCTGGQAHLVTSTPSQPSPSVSPAVGGWMSVRDEPARFSVSYPSTWFRASTAVTPKLSDPREILAVGSYPLRPGAPPHCIQYPVDAIEDLGPTDALLWVAERHTGGAFSPRRGLFLRSELRTHDESPACLPKPKVFFHGTLAFEDQGRNFEAYLAWGSGTPAETWRRLLAVMDSLQFDPGPLAPDRPRCGMLDPGGKQYDTVMLPRRGVPGDKIVLSGPTFRGEDGRFFPADRLEVWFNTKVPTSQVSDAQPFVSGPILHLATVENMQRCTFSTQFAVPDVPPGRYKITLFMFHEGGYGWWLPHFLTVRYRSSTSRIAASAFVLRTTAPCGDLRHTGRLGRPRVRRAVPRSRRSDQLVEVSRLVANLT